MLYRRWPFWWDFPVTFTPHALDRMKERGVSETDARIALEDCESLGPQEGRRTWIAHAEMKGGAWKFIVRPDIEARNLIVVTMYPLTR